ncbi:MAG: prepilin peptidase [Planctomycetota bacterium]|nr:MAG: prepilin peptidase [Planctomycetota bacterium]
MAGDALTREVLFAGGAFVLGAAVGSFLNVVIYRLPREDEGLSVARPRRSFCPSCRSTLRWYENIPLVSWLLQAGRCRHCREPIPLRYFGIELLTATLFTIVAYKDLVLVDPPRWGLAAVSAALLAAMVAVTWIDLDHMIIPDRIDKPAMLLAPFVSYLVPALHPAVRAYGQYRFDGDITILVGWAAALGWGDGRLGLDPRMAAAVSSLVGIAFGLALIWTIRALGSLAFRKEAMGLGDVKYMGMLGGYLGWTGVLLTLGVAVIAGALIGIVMKLFTREPYVPFGPFLSLGGAVTLLAREPLLWGLLVWYPSLVR